MRPLFVSLIALSALGAVLVEGAPPRAEMSAEEKARRAVVVARVGPKAVTAGELEDRLSVVPRFQLVTFGDTPDAIRKKFFHDVIEPEVLLALAAEDQKIDQKLPASLLIERARGNAALRATQQKVIKSADIPMADVERYYEDNRATFDAPDRYGIWRVLVPTREKAEEVLANAKKDLTTQAFIVLARDNSIDKATYLRGGNLGFVALDGTSNEVGLRVEASVPKAAALVKDGELVPNVVEEGKNFAVVWRRSVLGASRRTVAEAAAQIRDTLFRRRSEEAQRKLLEELRKANVKEIYPDLLSDFAISPRAEVVSPKASP